MYGREEAGQSSTTATHQPPATIIAAPATSRWPSAKWSRWKASQAVSRAALYRPRPLSSTALATAGQISAHLRNATTPVPL